MQWVRIGDWQNLWLVLYACEKLGMLNYKKVNVNGVYLLRYIQPNLKSFIVPQTFCPTSKWRNGVMWKGKFSQGCAPQQLLEPVLGAINFDWVIAVLYSFLRHSVVLGATVLLRDPDFSFSCWTDGFTYGSRIIWYMEEFMVDHTCKTSPKSSPLHHRASEVVWGGVLVCQKDVVTEVLWFVQMQRKLKPFCCCCCSVCFGGFLQFLWELHSWTLGWIYLEDCETGCSRPANSKASAFIKVLRLPDSHLMKCIWLAGPWWYLPS